MADGLDVVAVGIKHIGGIVIRMIVGAKSRRAVINPAGGQAGGEESIDIGPRSGVESDVEARCHRGAFGYPKITPRIGAFPLSFRDAEAG